MPKPSTPNQQTNKQHDRLDHHVTVEYCGRTHPPLAVPATLTYPDVDRAVRGSFIQTSHVGGNDSALWHKSSSCTSVGAG